MLWPCSLPLSPPPPPPPPALQTSPVYFRCLETGLGWILPPGPNNPLLPEQPWSHQREDLILKLTFRGRSVKRRCPQQIYARWFDSVSLLSKAPRCSPPHRRGVGLLISSGVRSLTWRREERGGKSAVCRGGRAVLRSLQTGLQTWQL